MVPKNGLFAVVLVLDGVNGAAWPAGQRVLKFGILAETTGITQKRILFVVIDGATLMTLEYIFPAIRTDSRIGWY